MKYKGKNVSSLWLFLEYIAIFFVIVIPISVQAGIFNKNQSNDSLNSSPELLFVNSSPIDVPLLASGQNPNHLGARGGAEVQVNEGALVSAGPVGKDLIASTRAQSGEISIYTVRADDTISHIADMYGVTVNTIMWANDLTRASSIKEGQVLIILPIVGVRHTVVKGDTINSIAKKYDGDAEEIISYNELSAEEGLSVGSVVVVPGGAMHTAPTVTNYASPTKTSGGSIGGGWLAHPVPGAVKSQGIHGYNGVDLAAKVGTPVRAAASGEVIVSKNSGWNGGYGQYIVIRHSNGSQTLYAHLSSNSAGVGAYVTQGSVIGAVGNTGRSTGSHLHFEVRGASNPF